MRKILFSSLFIALFLGFWNQGNASHIYGSEITYSCIGTCTLRVHFKAYRECNSSIAVLNNTNFSFSGLGSGCNAPVPLGTWSVPVFTEITPVCPGVATNCSSGTIPGIGEEYFYRDFDFCAANCSTYVGGWTNCCRNPAITSIQSPSSQSTYNSLRVQNPAVFGCNNGPVYRNSPIVYLCNGSTSVQNLGATDPDGDSLVYYLDSVQVNPGISAPYASGYSPTSPFGSSWNVSLDPQSGDFTVAPNPGALVVGVVRLRTDEYRNGVKIGEYNREIQIIMINCPGNAPPIHATPGNASLGVLVVGNHIYTCGVGPIVFDIAVSDPNSNLTTSFWDQSIVGSTFSDANNATILDTVSGVNPTLRFDWQSPSLGTYQFKVESNDGACPILGITQNVYTLHVGAANGVTATATPACATVLFTGAACGGNGTYSWQWSGTGGININPNNTDSSFTQVFSGAGMYYYQLIVSDGALFTDTLIDSIQISTNQNVAIINPNSATVCQGQNLNLDAGTGYVSYLWSNAATTQIISVSTAGPYSVQATDANGCVFVDTVQVSVQGPTGALLLQNYAFVSTCLGNSDTIHAIPGMGSYLWSTGDTTSYTVVDTFGTVVLVAIDTSGCVFFDSNIVQTAPLSAIIGNLTTSTGSPMPFTKVYLIVHDAGNATLSAVDSTNTNAAGVFSFCQTGDSVVLIKAAPDSATYPSEMPTYADTSLIWSGANSISLTGISNTVVVNFSTKTGSNPGGPGFIGGLISMGANKKAGAPPIPGVQLFLFDLNLKTIIGQTRTAANGYFQFANIPDGTYTLIPDDIAIVGDLDSLPILTVNAQNPVQDSLKFEVNFGILELVVLNGIKFPGSNLEVKSFPNPFSGSISIAIELPNSEIVSMKLYDAMGREVIDLGKQQFDSGRSLFEIDGQKLDLKPGVFFLKLEANGNNLTQKLLFLGNH